MTRSTRTVSDGSGSRAPCVPYRPWLVPRRGVGDEGLGEAEDAFDVEPRAREEAPHLGLAEQVPVDVAAVLDPHPVRDAHELHHRSGGAPLTVGIISTNVC